MSAPSKAALELAGRARALAPSDDPADLRAALDHVLGELGVVSGDPAWTDGKDVIGSAFERLVPGRARRALGQFFTPLGVGRAMARWLLREPRTLVLDPACGSGSLLIATAQEDTAGTPLLGLDVDPLAIKMAAANRLIRELTQLELTTQDFLLDDLQVRPDGLICNPPYTRHHALSAETKQAVHRGFDERLGVRFSRLASLHVLFLVRALEVTTDDARLAFVTPAHWLDMGYAREIKRLLLDRAHVEAVISFDADDLLFGDVLTTASITLINKGIDGDRPTRILHSVSLAGDGLVVALDDPDAGPNLTLARSRKWSRPPPSSRRRGTSLQEVAHVRRGVATGHNAFFVLSEQERRELRLSRSSVRACISSPRQFPGVRAITEATFESLPETAPRWLLTPRRPRTGGPLAAYLARGREEFGVLGRYLVKQRMSAGREWYEVEADVSAPILFTYFNRARARFVRNYAGGVPLNNWLIIEPHVDIDADALFSVLTSKQIQARLMDDCRLYGNGLWKLEPSELKKLVLPIKRSAIAA